MFAITLGMHYRMVIVGGKARLSRPSHVVYPLPSVRLNTGKLTRSLRVRDAGVTAIAKVRGIGEILPMTRYALIFP